MTQDFAALLAPFDVQAFYAEVHDKKPLHIKGGAGKFAEVAGWPEVSTFLSQAGIWTVANLELALEGKKIEAAQYCKPGLDRDARSNQLVDLAKVRAHLQRGCSLVLNDVTTLAPGIARVAAVIGNELQAKVQANLYCSWQAFRGFSTHFDVHDVWAVHLAGRKTWNIYQRHFENPIPHAKFRGLGSEFHKAHHGPVSQTVMMEPGDLLYIPRGWYHDALAESEATLHIAFGSTPLLGLDIITQLFEAAVDDPLMRAGVGGDLASHVRDVGERLLALAQSESFLVRMQAVQAAQRPLLGELALPHVMAEAYRMTDDGFALRQDGSTWRLEVGKKAVTLPSGLEGPVAWIINKKQFTSAELAEGFPQLGDEVRVKLLRDLLAMRVLVTV
jgi:hypothetical protein